VTPPSLGRLLDRIEGGEDRLNRYASAGDKLAPRAADRVREGRRPAVLVDEQSRRGRRLQSRARLRGVLIGEEAGRGAFEDRELLDLAADV
jgi:hypothetical protein